MNDIRRTSARSAVAGLAAWLVAGCAVSATWAQGPASGRPAASAPAAANEVVRGYAISGADVTGVAARLKELFGARGGIRIAADTRSGQVVVFGPAEVQQDVSAWLAGQRLLAIAPAASFEPVSPAPPPLAQPLQSPR